MELKQEGDKLSGTYIGDELTTGTVSSGAIHLLATSDDGTASDENARVKNGAIPGSAIETHSKDKDHPLSCSRQHLSTSPVVRHIHWQSLEMKA